MTCSRQSEYFISGKKNCFSKKIYDIYEMKVNESKTF